MSNFDEVFDEFVDMFLSGAKELAKQVFDGFEDNAKADARAFVDKTEADLKRWAKLLADGELSKDEFENLVRAKKALAEIHELTQAGVALTKIERFRSGLVDLAIDSAFKVFL